MQKKTEMRLLKIIRVVGLVPIVYVLGGVAVRSFWSISDDNPLVAVVSTLGGVSIWCFYTFRLHNNIRYGADNPYGEALSWTAERSARLVVALLMLFMIGATVKESIATNNYWLIAVFVAAFLVPKPTKHLKEWRRGLRFLYDKIFMQGTRDKCSPSDREG